MYVDPQIIEYAVRLSTATRDPAAVGSPDLARYVTFGASPRASINMVLGAKALAFLRGRDYALPQDLSDVAPDVLRHRLVLSYDALADDIPADRIVDRIMQSVPPPTVAPRQSATPSPPTDFTVPPGVPHNGPVAPLPAWPRN